MNTDSDPTQVPPAANRRPGRGVIIALVISVALNLIVLGAVLGRALNGPPPGPMPRHLGWILQSLDSPTREEIVPLLRDNRQAMAPLRRAMGDAQRRFQQVVQAEPLDEAALTAALTDVQTTSAAYQQVMHTQMATVLSRLDHSQRRQVVEFLHQRRSGHERPVFGRHGPDEGRGPNPPPP